MSYIARFTYLMTCKIPQNHKSLSGEVTITDDRQQWLDTFFTTLTSFHLFNTFSSSRRTEARSTKDSNDDTKLAAAK